MKTVRPLSLTQKQLVFCSFDRLGLWSREPLLQQLHVLAKLHLQLLQFCITFLTQSPVRASDCELGVLKHVALKLIPKYYETVQTKCSASLRMKETSFKALGGTAVDNSRCSSASRNPL